MRGFLKNKGKGFYVVLLSLCAGIISLIRFVVWAPQHYSMDSFVVTSLGLAIIICVILMLYENSYLKITAAALYGAAGTKIITGGIGSFVDALQGIKMFGDASQVGTILTIAGTALLAGILVIVCGFMRIERRG